MKLEIVVIVAMLSITLGAFAAEDAGILEGDILLEVDGNPVTADQLNELSDLMPDTVVAAVSLRFLRNGIEIELELITDYLVPRHL